MNFMTEYGKTLYSEMVEYGLGEWYNPMGGHVLVNENKVTLEVVARIHKFLSIHQDWCMGYENDFLWVAPKEHLI